MDDLKISIFLLCVKINPSPSSVRSNGVAIKFGRWQSKIVWVSQITHRPLTFPGLKNYPRIKFTTPRRKFLLSPLPFLGKLKCTQTRRSISLLDFGLYFTILSASVLARFSRSIATIIDPINHPPHLVPAAFSQTEFPIMPQSARLILWTNPPIG